MILNATVGEVAVRQAKPHMAMPIEAKKLTLASRLEIKATVQFALGKNTAVVVSIRGVALQTLFHGWGWMTAKLGLRVWLPNACLAFGVRKGMWHCEVIPNQFVCNASLLFHSYIVTEGLEDLIFPPNRGSDGRYYL
jgi:hypothetical protein